MRQKLKQVRDAIDEADSQKQTAMRQEQQSNQPIHEIESMQHRIERIAEDLKDIKSFYNIKISASRRSRLEKYYDEQLNDLQKVPFDSLDQQEKIDYLLLQNYIQRNLGQLKFDEEHDRKATSPLSFALGITRLCEDRQNMISMDGKRAAHDVHEIGKQISDVKDKVKSKKISIDEASAFRAATITDQLRDHLAEWYGFFNDYDPTFSWWVKEPYTRVTKGLKDLVLVIREELLGIKPGDEDTIVGEPIGYEGLLADLKAEKIPYTPEELIAIGEKEWIWCETQMKLASHEMGFDDWRDALEAVKNNYVAPGNQPRLIRELAVEAIDYVSEHNLVTVPPVAAETWCMFMMPPAAQKVNPFFLGGDSIEVSYPTSTMSHEAKLMSMRGNNIHFARATVFHELIPGHHLQMYMITRYRPYRQMFDTPFWIEGWSLYWEMILWDKQFQRSPEDRIGMLFWRMHRCARIIFSIKFHLGDMTPQQCVDMLVERVGHERATAEGEVRRSFNGDYSALYQAGYMLGALQLYALRGELVESGKMDEKSFHDRILKENEMPIELLRALMLGTAVKRDFEASWRFYKGL